MKYIEPLKEFLSLLSCLWHNRQYRHAIKILAFLSGLIFIISAILAGYSYNEDLAILKSLRNLCSTGFNSTLNFIYNNFIVIITVSIVILVILVIICILKLPRFLHSLARALKSMENESIVTKQTPPNNNVKRNYVLRWTILAFILIVLIIFFLVTFDLFAASPTYRNDVFKKLLTNSGGLFALITGAFTVIGTYIAIQTILGMKHTITSYAQLHVRLTALINEACKSDEEIYVLSYSPLSGHWQNDSDKLRKDFEDALRSNKEKIHFACLNEYDHLWLLSTIASRRSDKNAKHVMELQELYGELMATDDNQPLILPWEKMPSYYLFASESRAIIVTPVGLPLFAIAKDDEKVRDIVDKIKSKIEETRDAGRTALDEYLKCLMDRLPKEIHIPSSPTVETLGFETTDYHIIDTIHKEFKKFNEVSEINHSS